MCRKVAKLRDDKFAIVNHILLTFVFRQLRFVEALNVVHKQLMFVFHKWTEVGCSFAVLCDSALGIVAEMFLMVGE